VAGQSAGIDLANADNALSAQLMIKISARAPIGGNPSGIAHDIAGYPDPAGLAILVIPARVAAAEVQAPRFPGALTAANMTALSWLEGRT